MPLTHPPGEAQVDFGHAVVKMDGVLRKICFFVMTLPYSDADIAMMQASKHATNVYQKASHGIRVAKRIESSACSKFT